MEYNIVKKGGWMKKILLVALLMFSLIIGVYGDNFEKGGKYLTGQIGINSYAIPFGASFGFGLSNNIEVGATVMAYFWSGISVIQPSADIFYHFTSLDIPVDLFAGGSIGYAVVSGGGISFASEIYVSPVLGARYFFKDNLAVSLRLYFSVTGGLSGVGSLLGLTLVL